MKLAERLLGLELSMLPVWVFDPEHIKFCWANAPAAELWGARSLVEFLARDLSDISESVKVRLRSFMPTLEEGGSIREDFTFYPKGKPVTLSCVLQGVLLDDGNVGMLAQAASQYQQLDASLIRGVEALRHSSVMVSMIDGSGLTLMRNAAAAAAFGEAAFGTWFCEPEVAHQLQAVLDGAAVYSEEVQVETVAGRRWHAVDARAVNDPASGKRVVLVQQVDVTKRRIAEDTAAAQSRLAAQLTQTLALVQAQHDEIMALSAPILEVREGTLLLPLIGALTAERGNAVTQRVLSAIVHHRARNVILDLTGTLEADPAIPGQLNKLAHAIALLGSKVVLSGVSPRLARVLAESGFDWTGLPVGQSLANGLRLSQDAPVSPRAAAQRAEPTRAREPVTMACDQAKRPPS